jgi:hypothetical protein
MELEKKRGLGVCRNGKRRLHKHPSAVIVMVRPPPIYFQYRNRSIYNLGTEVIESKMFYLNPFLS